MNFAARLLPLALTLAIGVAPAAGARTAHSDTEAQSNQMMGTQVVLPGGMTLTGQVEHAYTEALHAHAALAMGMPEMAANHLGNVDLVLANLETHGMPIDATTRQRINQIRQQVSSAKNTLSERQAGIKATQAVVLGFSSFFDQMASRPLGGGGGTEQPMISVIEALGQASDAAALTQVSLASRNWEVASLHAREAVRHLDEADKAATHRKTKSSDQQQIRALSQEAQNLNSAIERRSTDAVKQAGVLVNRIGMELPKIASSHMGGGAGM